MCAWLGRCLFSLSCLQLDFFSFPSLSMRCRSCRSDSSLSRIVSARAVAALLSLSCVPRVSDTCGVGMDVCVQVTRWPLTPRATECVAERKHSELSFVLCPPLLLLNFVRAAFEAHLLAAASGVVVRHHHRRRPYLLPFHLRRCSPQRPPLLLSPRRPLVSLPVANWRVTPTQ
jgi:hypothetical protein